MRIRVHRIHSVCLATTMLGAALPSATLAQKSGAVVNLPDAPSYLGAFALQTGAPAPAQGTASITGLITDVNGGVVPGATILSLDAKDQPNHQTTAGPEGEFRLAELPAGAYRLRIEAKGLQTFETPEIKLLEGQAYQLPATALPIAAAGESVDVVMTTQQIAAEELKEETQQRVLGILPNFYTSYVWNAAPLSAKQKYHLAFRTIIDPWVFARTGIIAGIQQARGTYPEYGDGGSGFAKRYFAAYGDAVTGRVLGSAVLPAIFHQDPRYFYRGTGGIPRRALHAMVSSVAARTDGGRVELNYSHTVGNFAAGYISRTWHPGSQDGLSLALENMFIGIGESAGRNLIQEFLLKKISRGTPPFAKGKPPEEKESAVHP